MGGYLEGLDVAASYAVLERYVPHAIRTYRTAEELGWLTGTGVTAAAIYHMREQLDAAGFERVKIIASSGFGPSKCKLMASVKAPVDVIGTGSYLPERWTETYATADVIAYDGQYRVKVGREFLFPAHASPAAMDETSMPAQDPVERARRRRQGPPDHLDDADPADHPRLPERAGDEGTAAEDRQRERGQRGHAQPGRDKRAGRRQVRHLEAWPDRQAGLRKGGIGQRANARSRDHRDERSAVELLPTTVVNVVQRVRPDDSRPRTRPRPGVGTTAGRNRPRHRR